MNRKEKRATSRKQNQKGQSKQVHRKEEKGSEALNAEEEVDKLKHMKEKQEKEQPNPTQGEPGEASQYNEEGRNKEKADVKCENMWRKPQVTVK